MAVSCPPHTACEDGSSRAKPARDAVREVPSTRRSVRVQDVPSLTDAIERLKAAPLPPKVGDAFVAEGKKFYEGNANADDV